ncbi:MAG: MFS transporter [Gemmataceae bacterium]|nr:MFS transporter [Gemmataceae bacterium]
MHFDHSSDAPPPSAGSGPWYKELTRYHWFVLTVAALGWLFDCLDQQLFVLARPAAMKELVAPRETAAATDLARRQAGDLVTTIFIAGWACGGLLFGMLGDRIGRARTMVITILTYSLFTGLNAFSQGVWDFALYRFLTGLGVGGEFAVGVALVAEVMPARARPYTLGLLQALSAIGNISAAFINLGLGLAEEQGLVSSPWRIMFMIGAVPALLALVVRAKLKEPEQWQRASHDDAVKKQLGSYKELFGDPLWRRHALLGLALGCSGIIGLWSVGFFTPDLIRYVQRKGVSVQVYEERIGETRKAGNEAEAKQWAAIREHTQKSEELPSDLRVLQGTAEGTINGRLSRWSSYTSLMINVGAAFGMFGFGALAQRIGRKPTFVIGLLAAFVSTVAVFWFLSELWQVFVMVPIMGFCQLSLFAGYAIYFPELFPTRLRSTGTSFCYNVGRFVAALGPLAKAWLEEVFHDPVHPIASIRYAGVTMCLVFLIGLLVLPFLPETKGKPLPE